MTFCGNEGHFVLSFFLTVFHLHRTKPVQASTAVKTTYLMDLTVWKPYAVDLILGD